jgi:hypothetical protein
MYTYICIYIHINTHDDDDVYLIEKITTRGVTKSESYTKYVDQPKALVKESTHN